MKKIKWLAMISAGLASGLLLLSTAAFASTEAVLTPAEDCRYAEYSQAEGVARFLSYIDAISKEAAVQVVGRTREVEEFPAKDLYLCILTESGVATPEKLDRTKPTIMITASQHGNEQSAKEAALEFVRDLALGELRPWLKQANFLVMPQCNPYGNQFDRRQNEQNLDMNRDHTKIESQEVAAIHRVFRSWMPEVTLDMHEKGDDYYRVSLGCVSNINISAELQDFSRETILREVDKALDKKKITFCEYVVSDEIELNTSTGVNYPSAMLSDRETMLRFSTVELNDGRSGPGIYETLSFIMECASRHDLPTLRERTRWQSGGLRAWAESLIRHGEEIVTMVNRLRAELLAKAQVYSPDDVVHVRMEYVRDPKQPRLVRQRFQTASSPVRGILRVDKKAGDPVMANDLAPYPWPSQLKVVEQVVLNWFPGVESRLAVTRPVGYIIPGDKTAVVETLLRHRMTVDLVTKDAPLSVETYEVKSIEPADFNWLPPKKIEVDKKVVSLVARKGDFFVSCAQPAANLIPCLLEPQSQFGLICFRKLMLLPKANEIFAIYRYVEGKSLPLIPYRDFAD
jgi:hypothetical protein